LIVLGAFLWLGYFLAAQTIQITDFPNYGINELLQGTTSGINPADYGVVCYVFVQEGGGWWGPKPSFENPVTPIQPDGSFSVEFITGGYDQYCTRMFVYLKHDLQSDPPQVMGGELPSSLLDMPCDVVARPHGSRKITWPDPSKTWTVKESVDGYTMGPGDNLFSADPGNVWIDAANQLHLKIVKRNNLYYCSEIIADTSFGYGKYTFVYNSNPNILDPKTVFGFFTWDDISPYSPDREAYYREIDFEFSRWGNSGDPNNAQFVIQPWEPAGNLLRYNTGTTPGTIHSFAWYKDSVVFESLKPDSSRIKKWVYTGAYLPPPGKENIRINLWLMNKPPNTTNEIVLKDYKFQYHLRPPAIFASDGTGENQILIEWNDAGGLFYQLLRSSAPEINTALPVVNGWITGNSFSDVTAETGKMYYYWLRCADNSSGSNVSGYISDFSQPDSGFISENHVVGLNAQWGSVSSFITPVNSDPDSLFQQLGNNLILIQNQSGVYFPEMGINTLGQWDSQQGYIIKMAQSAEMTFSGLQVSNKTMMLLEGWNLIPVISGCSVDIQQIFEGSNPVIIKEVAGYHVWWPAKGIYTLQQLLPGKAYFVLMNGGGEITFPECP